MARRTTKKSVSATKVKAALKATPTAAKPASQVWCGVSVNS
uniref:Uncharacterized protein n=1 Tax=Anopheles albimanus TaxID=7167 RepID=A0A182FZ05_ANOAL